MSSPVTIVECGHGSSPTRIGKREVVAHHAEDPEYTSGCRDNRGSSGAATPVGRNVQHPFESTSL